MPAPYQNIESPTDFPAMLKSATSTAHNNLESLAITSRIMSPEVTVGEYKKYLELMYQVISEVESRFFPVADEIFPDLKLRRKSMLLANDIDYLGGAHLNSDHIFGNGQPSLPFIAGIIYVIEGSTLGGRYILKNIESALNLTSHKGASFLAGYGNHTGSLWKKFMNSLEKYAAESSTSDEIISGAEFAFEAIHTHFVNSSPNSV